MKENKKWFISLIVILVLFILGLLFCLIFNNKINNTPKATTTKTTIKTPLNTNENECNINNCNIYKDEKISIDLKNITKSSDDYKSNADIYINGQKSSNISFPNNGIEEQIHPSQIDLELINENYFLIKFAGEVYYTNFYLFNINGELITDFEKEKKVYDNLFFTVFVENNKLTYLYFVEGEGYTTEGLYCAEKAKPTDILYIHKYASIQNDRIIIEKEVTTTWEEEYRCKDGETEFCGDISKIICE